MLVVQAEVWEAFGMKEISERNVQLANHRKGWCADLDGHLIQSNLDLGSVKLSEHVKLLEIRQPD